MESFAKVISFLDIPASISQDVIHLYQHCTNNKEERCESQCVISNAARTVLINNLLKKPQETSNIIHQLKNAYEKKHVHLFEDIILTTVINYLEMFSHDNQNEIDVTRIYSLLSVLETCEVSDNVLDYIFSKIYELIENEKLSKDLVYLTLLPQKKLELLYKLVSYEKSNFNKCDINDSLSLFRYCLYKNRHWLFHMIENDIDLNALPSDITDKILLLKTNFYVNENKVDYQKTENTLYKLSKNVLQDKFLHFYLSEIKWNLELYACISKINPAARDNFKFLEVSSCLQTLSSFVNLESVNEYERIHEILVKYENYLTKMLEIKSESTAVRNISEVDLYNGYCLLLATKYYIVGHTENCTLENIQELLKKIKNRMLQSENLEFQLEVFENMFVMLFIQAKHVNENLNDASFLCGRKEIQFIATFLKIALKEIKGKQFMNMPDKSSRIYQRFSTLKNYVLDSLWRLDLLKSQNVIEDEKNVINIMLSSARTLTYMCLQNDNFQKAHDVIQVYNMQDSYVAQEVEFMEKMQYLKSKKDKNAEDIIKFCTEHKTVDDKEYADVFEKYKNNEIINSLNSGSEMFMNLIDAALVIGNDYETCKQLFEAAFQCIPSKNTELCNYLEFCTNISQVLNEIGPKENLATSHILNCSSYPLTINKLHQQHNFHERFKELYEKFLSEKPKGEAGSLDCNHKCQQTFLQLAEFCNKDSQNYLNKFYNFLKLFSKILSIKGDHSGLVSLDRDSCIFDLIYSNMSRIVGKLLSEFDLKPKDLERLFSKLNLDLMYHIAWNCLPNISLQIDAEEKSDNIAEFTKSLSLPDFVNMLKQIYGGPTLMELNLITPDVFLLSYIRNRNWLLAYLINKIYLVEEAKPDINSDRTKYFNNLLNLPSVRSLKKLYEYNSAVTVMHQEINVNNLLPFIPQNDGENFEDVLSVINCLPERLLQSDTKLIHLKDLILCSLIRNNSSEKICKSVEYITDDDFRISCILENLTNWPGNFCIHILNSQLNRKNLDKKHENELRKWFYQVELYENIKHSFRLDSWNDVYKKSSDDPKELFLLLLTSKQTFLLLKWIEMHKPKSVDLLHLINTNYFTLILEDGVNLEEVKILLDLLQFDHRIQICKNLIKQIRKVQYLEFIIDYLITLLPELESEYINEIISLKMFSCFTASEHEYMFCLIKKPLLIIEQLIMNIRLEKLSAVLEIIKQRLIDCSVKNITTDISFESIDYLLRTYAKKSLDFRGIHPSAGLRNLELKLMQSLDTVSVDSERKIFIMPAKVPNKEQWIQNNEALECMCCQDVTFSMFNRRHHCRRCGRVICGNCSHKRMEIPEYGSIPVRICNDCYKQSQPEDPNMSLKSDHSSSKSGSITCWILTNDERHNDIAREEFSYEYAPSVSLCLSILKLHSNSVEYPKFLLEECKTLLPYLQDAVSEIDFSFVIQMIKSLVTVAKLTSLHNSYKPELSQCDEILLHIEVLRLLVERDCLELFRSISNKNKSGENYMNSSVLRRLRDKLLEQEQWPLALEVSTKAGLDKTGVFAAWGKNYLKAGCLQLAREKFQYCLEKNTVHDMSLDLSISYDYEDPKNRSQLKSLNLSTVSENRPSKTPPLVNEIISVLESTGRITDKSVFKTFQNASLNSSTLSLNTNCGNVSYDPAVCILNKLKNLKNVATGTSQSRKNSRVSIDKNSTNWSNMEPCFHNECLYYLMRYASHLSILYFYIRHEEFDKVLNYILENKVNTDTFIDIYMKCLEDGQVEFLQEHMSKIDSTLYVWENYLKSICRHLETNSMFNVLYQLQLFMCDYIRAAMTCIKFYQENAHSFKELLDRDEFLQKAQAHLKQELEHEQWVQVSQMTSGRKISTSSCSSSQSRSSSQPSLTMKIDPRNIDRYINTIWRQIEVTKFLAKCEMDDRPTLEVLNEIFPFQDETSGASSKTSVPTLFDSQLEKTKLAVLALVCGKNVEEGFGIAFRIIEDHNLKYLKIYCLAGKYLAQILRETAVTDLVSCIRSSGLNMETVSETCDEVLMVSVCSLTKANGTAAQLENLIRLINDPGIKIDAYIESKHLKRAYLLAVRYNRNNDIKKILREAERQNQPQIKVICLKRLNQTQ